MSDPLNVNRSSKSTSCRTRNPFLNHFFRFSPSTRETDFADLADKASRFFWVPNPLAAKLLLLNKRLWQYPCQSFSHAREPRTALPEAAGGNHHPRPGRRLKP